MSAVDVLEVFDFEMSGWDEDSRPYKNLAEARDAVAELMEADAEYDAAIDSLWNSARLNAEGRVAALDRRDAAAARRVAAMARCKGESA